MTEEQQIKLEALAVLRRRWAEQQEAVRDVDERLGDYFEHLCQWSSATAGDDNDLHNVYEILGAVKFLRLMRTYEFDVRKVRQVIRLREGVWHKNGKVWRYVSGGIKCPGTTSPQVYMWQPFQVFVLASVFGFKAWVDTQLTIDDRDTLLDTERMNDAGHIEDLRRLCTDFTCYMPRKTDKTGLAAFIAVVFFLLEDFNAEIYCTANASDQSKILHRRIKMLLGQLDDGSRIRMTETVCDWRESYKSVRDTSIRPLSAGGKTKDGMFAQLCCADEYGSAAYTNGKSDMKRLVEVVQSSMGPRREPLTFTTTTAGRITTGPFIEKLTGLHALLEMELKYERGEAQPVLSTDRILTLCLEPDAWERDEQYLLTSKTLRRKINPMLGKIVQHQFYEDEISKARMDGDVGEVVSKLFNVYHTAKIEDWLKSDDIRKIQIDKRIIDLKPVRNEATGETEHWQIFTGMDFSLGDDLYAHGYLCFNGAMPMGQQFFADMDAWITREAMEHSPYRPLYQQWERDGWLHVVDAKIIPPTVSLDRFDELVQSGCGVFRAIGYDPYASKIPINALKSYVQGMGADPDQMVFACRQNNATMNGPIDSLFALIMNQPPVIQFSNNPMWAWEAGNAAVEKDRMENKRIVKRQADTKIDNLAALLDAMQLFEMFDGK